MNLHKLRKCITSNKYEISMHAQKERAEEYINIPDIEDVILTGEIIEDYPDDPRGASCLVSGISRKKNIHVICAILPNGWARIITVYIPRVPKWLNPKQRRN